MNWNLIVVAVVMITFLVVINSQLNEILEEDKKEVNNKQGAGGLKYSWE